MAYRPYLWLSVLDRYFCGLRAWHCRISPDLLRSNVPPGVNTVYPWQGLFGTLGAPGHRIIFPVVWRRAFALSLMFAGCLVLRGWTGTTGGQAYGTDMGHDPKTGYMQISEDPGRR